MSQTLASLLDQLSTAGRRGAVAGPRQDGHARVGETHTPTPETREGGWDSSYGRGSNRSGIGVGRFLAEAGNKWREWAWFLGGRGTDQPYGPCNGFPTQVSYTSEVRTPSVQRFTFFFWYLSKRCSVGPNGYLLRVQLLFLCLKLVNEAAHLSILSWSYTNREQNHEGKAV